MIIDSLTHVTPDGRWFHTGHDASETRLLREMDDAKADHAVVVALAGFISNEFVLEVCRRHSGRLVPGASFDPSTYGTSPEAAREFRSQLRDSPFRVLKLHPRLNRYDPLDSRCLAVLEDLASWKRRIPVWLDGLFHYRGGKLSKPLVETVHEIVGRFPNVDFVLLHGGGSWMPQIAQAVRDCSNAFIDLSLTLYRHGEGSGSLWLDMRHLLGVFDRRMVTGSDFPEVAVPAALDCFRRLSAGVAPDKSANVLGNNLARILNLDVP